MHSDCRDAGARGYPAARGGAAARAVFPETGAPGFQFFLKGWGGAPSDGTTFLTPIAHSFDGKGRGDFNTGRAADHEVDRAIERASVEMDDAIREGLLAAATARIREQAYMIPLHRQVIPWAARAGVSLVHRMDNVLGIAWVEMPLDRHRQKSKKQ